jgi:RNA polymerase sigma-70 factor (ECF subfamily)
VVYSTAVGPGSTSTGLIQRVRANEPQAWEKLVALYGPLVYAWVRRAGVAEADASDIGQEVLLAVVANITRFDMQQPGTTFRGWLRVITSNKVSDHFRNKTRYPQELPAALADALPPEEEEDLSGLLPRVLAMLERQFQPQTWQAFWRTVVDDRSVAEVAAQLGMKPEAVRQAKARVLRRLRLELAELH